MLFWLFFSCPFVFIMFNNKHYRCCPINACMAFFCFGSQALNTSLSSLCQLWKASSARSLSLMVAPCKTLCVYLLYGLITDSGLKFTMQLLKEFEQLRLTLGFRYSLKVFFIYIISSWLNINHIIILNKSYLLHLTQSKRKDNINLQNKVNPQSHKTPYSTAYIKFASFNFKVATRWLNVC